jgi:DNA-binding LacI/PurR family transcriptional regulator
LVETLPGGAARIRDVAERAGVGVATVSRVLNGRANVAAPTRERVLAAIRELGFRPSSVARNLSLGRTGVVGVVVPFFTSPSAVERVRGIVEVLSHSSYDVSLFDVESPDRRRRAFELLGRADRTDGLLVVSLVPPPAEVDLLAAVRLPCVLVDALHDRLPHLVIDDVAGGAMATRHLVELGHERIAFIGDKPPDEYRFHSSRDRTLGFQQALADAGLPVREGYVREGTHSRHVARSIAEELLHRDDRPTAIFAASDTQALGVLEAARGLGLRVPHDLSVVGFDDIEIASYAGLTTVRQPLFESGRRGAELLLASLDGAALPAQKETLPLELVVRATTGPPAR